MKTETTLSKEARRLYDKINSIKTEAPTFDADWEELARKARDKRLAVIQKALDKQYEMGVRDGIEAAHDEA